MRPQKSKNWHPLKEGNNPGKPSKRPKDKKEWVKEYKWKSEKDFNSYPKSLFSNEKYDTEWKQETFIAKYSSPDAVEDSIKLSLRSSFSKKYILGREWRARNIVTGECIVFKNIEHYYD